MEDHDRRKPFRCLCWAFHMMFRTLAACVVAICAGLLLCAQSPNPSFPPGVFLSRGAIDAAGGAPPATYTKGANVAVQNVAFAGSTVTFTGMNGGVNYPANSVVIAFFLQEEGSYTFSSATIGGQSATKVTDTGDGKCALYQATMPGTSQTDTALVTWSNAPAYAGAVGGYFQNLQSSTATDHNILAIASSGADPQHLAATVTVPAGGFGVVMAGTPENAAVTAPTGITWTSTTAGSGDNFGNITGRITAIGSAHTATAGAGWNPGASGAGTSFNFAACMVAGAWH